MPGLSAATESARHAPRFSPTRYMGLLGERPCSACIVISTNFTSPENIEIWDTATLEWKIKQYRKVKNKHNKKVSNKKSYFAFYKAADFSALKRLATRKVTIIKLIAKPPMQMQSQYLLYRLKEKSPTSKRSSILDRNMQAPYIKNSSSNG